MNLTPELAPVYVRVHTRMPNDKGHKPKQKLPNKWANFALTFDCETTADLREDLNFLWWRFCELKDGKYVCQVEGVVYADSLANDLVDLIRDYARSKRADVEEACPTVLKVSSRTEFVNGDFWQSLRMGALIVCFNSPFDLSRLALEYRAAQSKNTGWSMVLWKYKDEPDKLRPRLRIKPKDSRSAFINLAGAVFRLKEDENAKSTLGGNNRQEIVAGFDPDNRLVHRGRFLDLAVLGWALRNRHADLNGFLRMLGLKEKKEHEPTGLVTREELEYGQVDVQRTLELLNAMKHEYDGFPFDLPPEEAMSAASITKAFLDVMGMLPPARKFNLPDEIHGKCMQAYFGGRSEIRIRHQEMPIVVCDATSEYPSVAVLLDLWKLLIASEVNVEDCTEEARNLIEFTSAESLLDPENWKKLAFFAQVKPKDDILPVRSTYSPESGNTNIGLNPLTCDEPMWFAGPDLAASKLQTGRAPEIITAFKVVPQGVQGGLNSTSIGARKFNPASDDFFRAVIEERKNLPKTHPHYLLLKIIANALYGVFAELNKNEFGKNRAKTLEVFSGESAFTQKSCVVERPGRWQFPPAAALITAGGRLLLTILERMVEEKRGAYLLTDTDSMLFVASEDGGPVPCPGGLHRMGDGTPAVMAMTWKEVDEICETLNRLNPYNRNVVRRILKVEDCNYAQKGEQQQLYGLAVSAKRYVVYARCGSNIQIIKPSEHGLGTVYVPDRRDRYKPSHLGNEDVSYPQWIVEAWEYLLNDHFRNIVDPENALVTKPLSFGNLPAVMRIRVTTANVMKALRRRDRGSAKPYNFALSPILAKHVPGCTLIAPFSKHPETWLTRDYTEIHSMKTVKLHGQYKRKKLIPQTLSTVIWRHFLRREDKSLGPDGKPCGPYTRGLLQRRPIQAMLPFIFIGKEVERKAQEGEDVSMLESSGPIRYQPGQTTSTRGADARLILRAKRFGIRRLMRTSGVSQHAIERFLKGARVHPSTRAELAQAIEKMERGRKGDRPS